MHDFPSPDLLQTLSGRFLERSDALDKSAAFPDENIKDLRQAGLLNMAMPAAFGGQDASLLSISRTLHALAMGCPSTALIFNMHLALTYQLAHLWRLEPGEPWASWLARIQEQNMLVGGALSEADSWNATMFPQCRAKPVKGGFSLNGSRSFCTGSNHLDLIQCTAQVETDGSADQALYLLLSSDMQGIEWKDDWQTLGMRGSASQGFRLNNVFIPQEAVLYTYAYGGMDTSELWLSFLTTSFIGFAAVYSGIAERASEEAKSLIQGRSRAPGTHTMAHKPSIQRHAAEMFVKLHMMKSVREESARKIPQNARFSLETVIDSAVAKQICITEAVRTVDHALALVGGQSYFTRLRLERLMRDVRAGPFHPFSQDDTLEMMGKLLFGLSFMDAPGWAL